MQKSPNQSVPKSLKIQFARLFGSASQLANASSLSEQKWRHALQKLLDELYCYVEKNVETDELHFLMICSGFAAARNSLKEENSFWPGFVEGIMRISFLLLGEYPDHRRRKGGKKKKDHYRLNIRRTLQYAQNSDQKVHTLYAATLAKVPRLSKGFKDVMSEFRSEMGSKATYWEFIRWYKKNYPVDYAKLF